MPSLEDFDLQRGVLVPQTLEGVLIWENAIQFDLVTRCPDRRSRPAPSHSYERARLSQDTRVEGQLSVDLEAWYCDGGPPALGFSRGQSAEDAAATFRDFFDTVDVVAYFGPGNALVEMAIVDREVDPQPTDGSVRISMRLEEQRIVELELRPAIPDADVEALGPSGRIEIGEF